MDEQNAMELLKMLFGAWRQRTPIKSVAMIAAIAWVATVALIGKWALVILLPVFLIVLYRIL